MRYLSPPLYRESLQIELKSEEYSVPVLLRLQVVLLEDNPLINYLRGKPLISETMISLAPLNPHVFHISVLNPLNVKIECFPAQPQT